MRVCFVSPFAYPLFNPEAKVVHGGAEIDLFFIGTELKQQPSFEVSFVVGDFGQSTEELYDDIRVIKSFRTNIPNWRKIIYGLFVVTPKLFQAMWRANASVYVQEGSGFETAIVALFCKLYRRKFVYRVASTIECDGTITDLFPLMGKIFLWGMRQAHAIVTEDQEEVRLLQKHYLLKARAIYDTTPLPNPAAVLPIGNRKFILWVSRLVPMKHPELFIHLAQYFPSEIFILIAPIDPRNLPFAERISDLVALKPNVTLIPGLHHQKLDEYYRQAKIFINTSDFEGYPNTFIEAGKYAVPIISLRVNPDGLLDGDQYGTQVNGKFESLVTVLKIWLNDEAKRQRAGTALSQYVRKTNDIQKNILAYVALFQRLTLKS